MIIDFGVFPGECSLRPLRTRSQQLAVFRFVLGLGMGGELTAAPATHRGNVEAGGTGARRCA